MHEPRRTVIEVVVVLALGITIALTANAMNSSGLKLGNDYFLDGGGAATRPTPTQPAPITATQKADELFAGLSDEVRDKLKSLGLTPIRQPQVKELFENPLYASDLYVIIDARADNDYAEGHIPGAHHLYYYEQEKYAPQVIPFTQMAEKVIVYCNGGNCEDSVLTAALLRDQYVVDPSKIFVYPEGFDGWKSAGLPTEKGTRNSGDIGTGATTKGDAK